MKKKSLFPTHSSIFFVNVPCFCVALFVFYSFALYSLSPSDKLRSLPGRPYFSVGFLPTFRRAFVASVISCNTHCRKNRVTRPPLRLLPLIRLVPTSRPFIVTSRSVNVRHGRFGLVLSTTKPVLNHLDPRETLLCHFGVTQFSRIYSIFIACDCVRRLKESIIHIVPFLCYEEELDCPE